MGTKESVTVNLLFAGIRLIYKFAASPAYMVHEL